MVNVIELTVSESRKINLGNYESTDIFLSLKANVSNEDVNKAYKILVGKVSENLDETEDDLKRRAKK